MKFFGRGRPSRPLRCTTRHSAAAQKLICDEPPCMVVLTGVHGQRGIRRCSRSRPLRGSPRGRRRSSGGASATTPNRSLIAIYHWWCRAHSSRFEAQFRRPRGRCTCCLLACSCVHAIVDNFPVSSPGSCAGLGREPYGVRGAAETLACSRLPWLLSRHVPQVRAPADPSWLWADQHRPIR